MLMLSQQLMFYSFAENIDRVLNGDRQHGYTICLLQEIKILIQGMKKKLAN
jgi:hypothetical protein